MSKKKRVILRIVAVLLFAAGLVLFFYPTVSRAVFDRQTEAIVESYEQAVADIQETDAQGLDELRAQMEAYNESLVESGQTGLADPFSYVQPSFDLSEWDLPEDIFGYLTIEAMDLTLPIYLGASEDNLAKGAAHLSQTSIPIGGTNTNAVISAHRGMRTAAMFREIERLNIGDTVQIRTPWETLTYQVTSICVINPDEVEHILIQEGRDMITLLTCHPYPTNRQRYLVYCDRVDDATGTVSSSGTVPEGAQSYTPSEISLVNIEDWIQLGLGFVLLAGGVVYLVTRIVKKCRNKQKPKKKADSS